MTDLTALTEITAPTTDDLVYVVDDPSGNKNPRKCSIANLVDARTKTLTNTTIDADGTGNSITNIENADIKSGAGIDATKIADGSVTSTEFKYINTLSDNAQTQIDGKSPTAGNTSLTTVGAIGTGTWESTDVAVAHGGTGSSTASAARTALGVAIGSDVQIYNANTALTTNTLNDFAVPTASLALGTQKITGLVDGVATTDAATKGQLDIAVASDITLKGAYNANTNSPNLDNNPTAGTILKGDHYVVSVAGDFYSEALQVGDSLISEVLNPSSIGDWIITNSQMVTPIVTANIADEAVTEGKIYISNAGNNGEFLSKQSGNNGGLTWATVPAGYNAPTIGTTGIGSGASVPSLLGLTSLTATGALTGGSVVVDNLTINANAIEATNTNGNIELDSNGTGYVEVKGNTNDGAIRLNCTANSHGQIIKSQPHTASADNILLLPTTGSNAQSTLVSEISTQTLTNKTLTSPTITGTGTIASGAITSSGAIQGTQVDITAEGDLRLQDASGGQYVGFEAPATVSSSYTLKMPPATGVEGKVLKMSSTANALEWGDAGGAAGAELTSLLQAVGYSAANQSPATEGSSAVSIFVKTIDSNNQGLYIRLKKNGGYQDVQIA